jgi:predicted transglutaminase-like cysteine proteinase
MSGRVAARSCAIFLVALPLLFGGAATGFAQYQQNAGAADTAALLGGGAPVSEPFGLDESPVVGGEVSAKWSGVLADIRAESDVLTRCRDDAQPCPAAARKFLAVIAEGRARGGRARLGVINRAINLAIRPESDLAQWGVPDRWSAPLATLTTGRGDCEDYAIAKYVALKEAGVSEDDLRFVIVRDLGLGEDHAVLAARLDDKWLVLDNRRLALLEDNEMPSVQPLFVLDSAGVRQFALPATANAAMIAAPSALGF